MSKYNKVLFALTGSIAAYKSCHIISKLVQNGCMKYKPYALPMLLNL